MCYRLIDYRLSRFVYSALMWVEGTCVLPRGMPKRKGKDVLDMTEVIMVRQEEDEEAAAEPEDEDDEDDGGESEGEDEDE